MHGGRQGGLIESLSLSIEPEQNRITRVGGDPLGHLVQPPPKQETPEAIGASLPSLPRSLGAPRGPARAGEAVPTRPFARPPGSRPAALPERGRGRRGSPRGQLRSFAGPGTQRARGAGRTSSRFFGGGGAEGRGAPALLSAGCQPEPRKPLGAPSLRPLPFSPPRPGRSGHVAAARGLLTDPAPARTRPERRGCPGGSPGREGAPGESGAAAGPTAAGNGARRSGRPAEPGAGSVPRSVWPREVARGSRRLQWGGGWEVAGAPRQPRGRFGPRLKGSPQDWAPGVLLPPALASAASRGRSAAS